jgi:hypothetical protein
MARDTPDERIQLLGLRLRQLSLDELRRLGEAARAESRNHKHNAFPPDAAFGLADYVGPKLTREERDALVRLWETVYVDIAIGLTGIDPANEVQELRSRGGWRRWLIGAPDAGARATDLINKAAGREFNPWLGVCAAGNACCAVLLQERLPADVKAALTFPWRAVFGEDVLVEQC